MRHPSCIAALFCLICSSGTALADGFAALVSPPRVEANARAGALLREVIEITNGAGDPAAFRVHTADFALGRDNSVSFQDEPLPGSCRPWVAIERPLVKLAAGATARYRFEVQVPRDAPATECRFAIMIEADEPSVARASAVKLPIVGRIGVIVYVTIGDAAPELEVFGPTVVTLNGQRLPALRIHNSGTAHTRLGGFLSGRDAAGNKYDFTPSDFPILPGEERTLALSPSVGDKAAPPLVFPVTVKGTLEWGQQRKELDEQFK
ncbi:MAG: hypothetical protein JSR67_07025 [Proteobacteria bacterium]|nr:hypothetical protein [Pseudomonadota bacterium]